MRCWKKFGLFILALTCVLDTSGRAEMSLKVYLLAGQSNMDGHAEVNGLPPELSGVQTDVLAYHKGSWKYLRPGLSKTTKTFGPEVTFGRDMANARPLEHIGLIKYAVGNTNLVNDWAAPDGNGLGAGPEYVNFMNAVTNALATLDPNYEPHIEGMLWMQGESDASNLSWAQAYEQNLTEFIVSVRRDVNEPNMPFVIGQISEASIWTYGAIVRQAQYNVSQTVPLTTMIITSDLPFNSDGYHYNAEGQMTLGYRFSGQFVPADFGFNGTVNEADFAVTGRHWYEGWCGACEGADITSDCAVDINDFGVLADHWLEHRL